MEQLSPVYHNYWACALEPKICNYWSLHTLKSTLSNKRSHLNEKPMLHNLRVTSIHHNERKPVHINEDPLQSEK